MTARIIRVRSCKDERLKTGCPYCTVWNMIDQNTSGSGKSTERKYLGWWCRHPKSACRPRIVNGRFLAEYLKSRRGFPKRCPLKEEK